jgi:hypothetical protein
VKPLPREARALRDAVELVGGRVAAAGGAGLALVALLNHAPVWLACLQGAAGIVAIRVIARIGRQALTRSVQLDLEAMAAHQEKKP